jgi:hypothetical protein
MAQPFSVRAALCTAAVMFFFGALATGDLPAGMLQFEPIERSGKTSPALPGVGGPNPRGAEPVSEAPSQGPPPGLDCSGLGRRGGLAGYQFHPPCAGRAVAPNGRWAVEVVAGTGRVQLSGPEGQLLDEIPGLADAMPFVVYWSPRSDWFFANHYLGSGLEQLRIFQIVNRSVIERSSVYAYATDEMVSRFPCLGRAATVVASGLRWSRDGRRIALTAYARPDACLVEREGAWVAHGQWEPLWMIGDVESGHIDGSSVRVRPDGGPELPTDGPYAAL